MAQPVGLDRWERYSIHSIGHDEQMGDHVVTIVGGQRLKISAGRILYEQSDGRTGTVDRLFARSREMHTQGAAGRAADPLLQARLGIIKCQMAIGVSAGHALANDNFDRIVLTGQIKIRINSTQYRLIPGPHCQLRTDPRFATPPPLYGNVPNPLVRNAIVAGNAGPVNMAQASPGRSPGSRSSQRRSASVASSRSMSLSSDEPLSPAESVGRSQGYLSPGARERSMERPRNSSHGSRAASPPRHHAQAGLAMP